MLRTTLIEKRVFDKAHELYKKAVDDGIWDESKRSRIRNHLQIIESST